MDLNKVVKKTWGWWQGIPKGTRLFIYCFVAWEVLMGLYFFLK